MWVHLFSTNTAVLHDLKLVEYVNVEPRIQRANFEIMLGFSTENWQPWASLVAQWLRIRLPMQGTWVRALVREDPTCRGATKPVRHNY